MKQDYVYSGMVSRVVDGDTIEIMVDLGFNVIVKERFRLANIDTPEIFRPSCEAERQHGNEAKKFLENTLGLRVMVQSKKTGKYGRWIADVYTENGDDVVQLLKEHGFEKRKNYL